ncbi:MAG: hypothetical protein R3A80_04010 [Bdellovibrionota bacterium]
MSISKKAKKSTVTLCLFLILAPNTALCSNTIISKLVSCLNLLRGKKENAHADHKASLSERKAQHKKKLSAFIDELKDYELLTLDAQLRTPGAGPQVLNKFPETLRPVSDLNELFHTSDLPTVEEASNMINLDGISILVDSSGNRVIVQNFEPRSTSTRSVLGEDYSGSKLLQVSSDKKYLIIRAAIVDTREMFHVYEINYDYIQDHRSEIVDSITNFYFEKGCSGLIEDIAPNRVQELYWEWLQLKKEKP